MRSNIPDISENETVDDYMYAVVDIRHGILAT